MKVPFAIVCNDSQATTIVIALKAELAQYSFKQQRDAAKDSHIGTLKQMIKEITKVQEGNSSDTVKRVSAEGYLTNLQ